MNSTRIVEYAKHDPALARMSIFRPVSKGKRSEKNLDIAFDYNGVNIRVESMELLDARDQTLLFVLIAMAGIEKEQIISKDSSGPLGKELWEKMNSFSFVEGHSIAFCTTFYKILQNCKMAPTGANYKFLENSLLRLAKTNITIKKGKQVTVTRLIVSLTFNEKEEVAIAINPRIAEAVTGQYIVIDLEKRDLLKNDTAKIIFSYLSSVINEGNNTPYLAKIDTLIERTWGEEDDATSSTIRGRKKQVKDALLMIKEFKEWEIMFKDKDIVSIKRKISQNGIAKTMSVIKSKNTLVL